MSAQLSPQEARTVARVLYAVHQRRTAREAAQKANPSTNSQAKDGHELGGRP